MTTLQQKKLMYNIFGMMLAKQLLRDEVQMCSKLKAIHKLLGTYEHLSEQERDNCIYYFFEEYMKGVSNPASKTDSHIRNSIIPGIKGFPYEDIAGGMELILAAKNNI